MNLQEHIRKVLREETENIEFPFMDTKVIDDEGNPLVMYHGGSYSVENSKVVDGLQHPKSMLHIMLNKMMEE